jgi:hypothetical protein
MGTSKFFMTRELSTRFRVRQTVASWRRQGLLPAPARIGRSSFCQAPGVKALLAHKPRASAG